MLYLRTQKIDKLLQRKFNVYHSIWEHSFKRMLQTNKDFRESIKRLSGTIYDPPTLRASFYGGRTDLSSFLWQQSDNPTEYGIYRDIRLIFITNMQYTYVSNPFRYTYAAYA